MAHRAWAVVALLLGAVRAEARPVSYQGGWTVIEETDRQNTALLVHYSPTSRVSVGLRSEWDRRAGLLTNGVQATGLLHRWFGEDYQANLYALGGIGAAQAVDGSRRGAAPAGWIGGIADWETRRFFVSYQTRWMKSGDLTESFTQSGRLGIAPYVANTGALHTWFMVEFDQRTDLPDKVGVTPLLRFFTGSALLETGWSVTDNRPLVNFTYRF